jgi:uncharacterized protein (DUF2237 family)
MSLNVSGTALQACSLPGDPITGFHRDGFCRPSQEDSAAHLVCAEMTPAFLSHQKEQGNDLSSVVNSKQRWCICANVWKASLHSGSGPSIALEATAKEALKYNDNKVYHALEVNESHRVRSDTLPHKK